MVIGIQRFVIDVVTMLAQRISTCAFWDNNMSPLQTFLRFSIGLDLSESYTVS